MKITESILDKFRKDFENQVKDLEAKYGFKISLGNISYGASQFTSKLTVTDTAGGSADDAEGKISLKKNGWKFGLTEADYNKRINYLGKVFLLKGIKSRRQRCPIIAEDTSNGQSYKLPSHSLNK